MSIEGLVVEEAYRHIDQFHHVKNMEPMALHILKTSQKPLVVAFRGWMRRAALRQALRVEREQKRMDEELAADPYARRSSWRRRAVVHPYYVEKATQQGHRFNDQDFVGFVQRENPKVFPKRDCI
jgi:hypothetical protein